MLLLGAITIFSHYQQIDRDPEVTNKPLQVTESAFRVRETRADASELVVRCGDGLRALPFFAVVTQADGKKLDGSGRGLYSDGRFASDGVFKIGGVGGQLKILLRAGPDYIPLETSVTIHAGMRTELDVTLLKWFSPEARGWYSGDNHVHPAHDQTGEIKTDLANAQLQARANGLSFVTQASSEFPFEDHLKLSTPDFLLRRSLENRQGSFAGHLNSPGVEIPPDERKKTMHDPMPDVAAIDYAHSHGAAIIHTHTMVPPQQLHWMGATGAYSYGVLGRTPDAMDLDGEASEELWFTMLNLGNRVGCSGSTDAALERRGSPAPGARRMYVQSPKFEYESFVKGIRAGRLFATNAGPLFAFVEMDGKGIGDTLSPGKHEIRVEIQSLYPLEEAQVIRSGRRMQPFNVKGLAGETKARLVFTDDSDGWYIVKAKDTRGNWVLTSPIYVEQPKREPKPFQGSLILEIGNFMRLAELRKQFMAHMIATVSPQDPLEKVEFLRDEVAVKTFAVSDGDRIGPLGKTPVTETFGEFEEGWQWVRQGAATVRFQADLNVDTTGWYRLRGTTRSGRVLESDSIRFDAGHPVSHAVSSANVFGRGVFLRHWGYGESGSLSNLKSPGEWWYPDNTYWRMDTRFGTSDWAQQAGDAKRETQSFRKTAALAGNAS